MRFFITIAGAVLLVLSSVTASDARLHAKRQAPTQSELSYYGSNSDTVRSRDISCDSVGLRNECSTHGGG